jgi:predicted DNA-binding transcriptional regulator AlpA
MTSLNHDLPLLLRLPDIIGERPVTPEQAEKNRAAGRGIKKPRPGRRAIVPVTHATIWKWVREGKFPPPIKLSDTVTVWRLEDVRQWVQSRAAGDK